MNKNAKWLVLLFIAASGLWAGPAYAQDQTVGGNLTVDDALTAGASSSSANFQYRANGTILSVGPYTWNGGGLLSSDASLSGPMFLWYPTKGSLWAGYNNGIPLSDTYIGDYSIALGFNNFVSQHSPAGIALGSNNQVNADPSWGWGCVALGDSNYACVPSAVAIGHGNLSGNTSNGSCYSVAIGGNNYSEGYSSIAMGQSESFGSYSCALGNSGAFSNYSFAAGYSDANGPYSVALGSGSANNYWGASIAIGYSTAAHGYGYNAAIGNYLMVTAYESTALGCFNVGGGNQTGWTATDPLFELGNGGDGNGHGNPAINGGSDAFIVYKNGNAGFQGVVTVAPGGDIPMYQGN